VQKRVAIALTVLLGIVMALAAWEASRSREPIYQGKSLSSWVESYKVGVGIPGYDGQPADEAVSHAGTNAVPVLLRFLRARDSALMVKLLPLIQKQHVIRIPYMPAVERNARGLRGFYVLGPEGKNAVPALIEMCGSTQRITYYAVTALGYIGPPARSAVPVLWRVENSSRAVPVPWRMQNSNPPRGLGSLRYATTTALRKILTAESAVPVLIGSLTDPDAWIRANAAGCLSEFPAFFY